MRLSSRTRLIVTTTFALALLGGPLLAPRILDRSLLGGEPPTATNDKPDVLKDSVGIELILIHAGQFTMGSPASEIGRDNDEQQHLVRLTTDFRMSRFPITRGQFSQFARQANNLTMSERQGFAFAHEGVVWRKVNGANWKNPGFPQTDDDPVVNVTWVDAMMFCQWLSRREGCVYRLPTEAEWEYCCRAGTHEAFPGGDKFETLEQTAWYDGNSGGHTHPVGQKKPNAWGFYDMGGNVAELCGDWYDPYAGNATDPIGIAAGNLDTKRVLRGSSWRSDAAACRSAARHVVTSVTPANEFGFRVCQDDEARAARQPSGGVVNPLPQTVNSIQMRFALIPAGEFMMGSAETQPGRGGDERMHKVRISRPFNIGVYPVTRGQFKTFVDASGHWTTSERLGVGYEWNGKPERVKGSSWKQPGFDQNDDDPVVNVSWDDAIAFCSWLSEKEKKTYRLPTEAEWEYACRANTTSAYYDGDSAESLAKAAWCVRNSGGRTHRVGARLPNAWGLYDMLGNAEEWCSDFWAPYDGDEATDPKGPEKPGTRNVRVLRGGSWVDELPACRCATRNANDPRIPANFDGFRVCMEVK